jgi:aminomethyltransferase
VNPAPPSEPLKRTPLYALHVELGAKMVPFAGYEMPVQYPPGILKEHLHTREKAGLFDVSHMGQALLVADDGRHETAARSLEALVPADILNLAPGRQRYTQLLNENGGTIDDLMVTRPAEPERAGTLILVVNASRKEIDYAHISARLPTGVHIRPQPDRALLALQGPAAQSVMASLGSGAASLGFMQAGSARIGPFACHVSRSGYTGEDGFEISVAAGDAVALARLLLEQERVQAIGLGARDSLRLEAGLCLYGHELDETISPIEAGLAWSIQKRRREEGGFPGAGRIQRELREGPARLRVGIRPDGRAPAREGTEILDQSGDKAGIVTSGGFAPTLNAPVAMGYIAAKLASPGTPVSLVVRGKPLAARIASLPFVAHRYVRKS